MCSTAPDSKQKPFNLKEQTDALGFGIVGQRLRRVRMRLGLSVRDLAEIAQVSKNTITRIEKGESVHLSTVKVLSRAMKYSPEKLLSNRFTSEHTFAVHLASESRWFNLMNFESWDVNQELSDDELVNIPSGIVPFSMLSSRNLDGRFNPNIMLISEPTIPRSHRGEEFAFVISGKIKVIFEHDTVELSKGDSIYFWAAEVHHYEPFDSTPAEVLSVIIDPFPINNVGSPFKRNRP